MRPFSPFCGTVSNAQLLILPEIIRMIAPGVVTTQLVFGPPASSSATDVPASSDSRPATAQPPEPAPTTTKSNVSLTRFPFVIPGRCQRVRAKRGPMTGSASNPESRDSGSGACAPSRNDNFILRQTSAFALHLASVVPRGHFSSENSHFTCHKILKRRPLGLSKGGERWYIRPAPAGLARVA